jgi:hypothetical protein
MPDDILINLPTTVKARTEEIVIRNQDPDHKRVDVYQSLRPVYGTVMGQPIKNFMRSTPIEALIDVTYGGITGLQVIEWIASWAAGVNAVDGPAQVADLTSIPPII